MDVEWKPLPALEGLELAEGWRSEGGALSLRGLIDGVEARLRFDLGSAHPRIELDDAKTCSIVRRYHLSARPPGLVGGLQTGDARFDREILILPDEGAILSRLGEAQRGWLLELLSKGACLQGGRLILAGRAEASVAEGLEALAGLRAPDAETLGRRALQDSAAPVRRAAQAALDGLEERARGPEEASKRRAWLAQMRPQSAPELRRWLDLTAEDACPEFDAALRACAREPWLDAPLEGALRARLAEAAARAFEEEAAARAAALVEEAGRREGWVEALIGALGQRPSPLGVRWLESFEPRAQHTRVALIEALLDQERLEPACRHLEALRAPLPEPQIRAALRWFKRGELQRSFEAAGLLARLTTQPLPPELEGRVGAALLVWLKSTPTGAATRRLLREARFSKAQLEALLRGWEPPRDVEGFRGLLARSKSLAHDPSTRRLLSELLGSARGAPEVSRAILMMVVGDEMERLLGALERLPRGARSAELVEALGAWMGAPRRAQRARSLSVLLGWLAAGLPVEWAPALLQGWSGQRPRASWVEQIVETLCARRPPAWEAWLLALEESPQLRASPDLHWRLLERAAQTDSLAARQRLLRFAPEAPDAALRWMSTVEHLELHTHPTLDLQRLVGWSGAPEGALPERARALLLLALEGREMEAWPTYALPAEVLEALCRWIREARPEGALGWLSSALGRARAELERVILAEALYAFEPARGLDQLLSTPRSAPDALERLLELLPSLDEPEARMTLLGWGLAPNWEGPRGALHRALARVLLERLHRDPTDPFIERLLQHERLMEALLDPLEALGDPAAEPFLFACLERPFILRVISVMGAIGRRGSIEALESLTGFFSASYLKVPARAAIEQIEARIQGVEGRVTIAAPDARGGMTTPEG